MVESFPYTFRAMGCISLGLLIFEFHSHLYLLAVHIPQAHTLVTKPKINFALKTFLQDKKLKINLTSICSNSSLITLTISNSSF